MEGSPKKIESPECNLLARARIVGGEKAECKSALLTIHHSRLHHSNNGAYGSPTLGHTSLPCSSNFKRGE